MRARAKWVVAGVGATLVTEALGLYGYAYWRAARWMRGGR